MEEDSRHSPSCVWLQAYGYGRVPLVEEDDEVKVELRGDLGKQEQAWVEVWEPRVEVENFDVGLVKKKMGSSFHWSLMLNLFLKKKWELTS